MTNLATNLTWQERYLERFYRSKPGWIDGTTLFYQLCASLIRPGSEILEVGAGPSNRTSTFLSSLGRLSGVDVDPDVTRNDALERAELITGGRYSFDDGTFEACVSNFVIEHIEDPDQHLAEVHRVLRRNGIYVIRTPNIYHYVSLVARCTPHFVHSLLANRLRRLREDQHEPYPTYYRMNSRGSVRRRAHAAGFAVETLTLLEREPSYGMASRVLFLAFMGYERLVNASPLLEGFRSNIVGVLRKL